MEVEEAAVGMNGMYEPKHVYTEFEIVEVTGDGNCLFSSVAHGACLRQLRAWYPDEEVKQLRLSLANLLRSKAVDELIRRREDSEWFIEGDFDHYTEKMRVSTEWGGEPELLMLSHVLRMPITVFIPCNAWDIKEGVTPIAHYGPEYGKHPITLLYVGDCHYDALHIHMPTTGIVEGNMEASETVPLVSEVGDDREVEEHMLDKRKTEKRSKCGCKVDKEPLFQVVEEFESERHETAERAGKQDKVDGELEHEVFQESLKVLEDEETEEIEESGGGVVVEEFFFEYWESEEESAESGGNEDTQVSHLLQNHDHEVTVEEDDEESGEEYAEANMFEID